MRRTALMALALALSCCAPEDSNILTRESHASGPLSAGAAMSTVPVAVLFISLQRHLLHGLTAGASSG